MEKLLKQHGIDPVAQLLVSPLPLLHRCTVRKRKIGQKEIKNVKCEMKKSTRKFNVGTNAWVKEIRNSGEACSHQNKTKLPTCER